MSKLQDLPKVRLLVYIPCHKDYEMAFKNARKLSDQILGLQDAKIELQTIISVNNVGKIPSQLSVPFTQVSHMQTYLGGDANITKGFVTALEVQPDYFWILSANEDLKEFAISNLSAVIHDNPNADLVVTNAAGRLGTLEINNVFLDQPSDLALGLISGVIYKFSSTKNSFVQATLFSWTGWGQLSVIQNFLSTASSRNLIEIPDSLLYEKPYTFSADPTLSEDERELVRHLYSHSFFGLPVLASCLWKNDPKSLRRFQSQWIKFNWYKINSFSKTIIRGDEEKLQRINWIKEIHEQSFRKFFYLSILYFLSSKFPASRFMNSNLAVRLLSFYKKQL